MSDSHDAGTDAEKGSGAPGRYDVPIETLEHGVRVRREDQVEDQATYPDDSSWAWNEDERQLRLAGGV